MPNTGAIGHEIDLIRGARRYIDKVSECAQNAELQAELLEKGIELQLFDLGEQDMLFMRTRAALAMAAAEAAQKSLHLAEQEFKELLHLGASAAISGFLGEKLEMQFYDRECKERIEDRKGKLKARLEEARAYAKLVERRLRENPGIVLYGG